MTDTIDYHLALTRACIAYAGFTGSCPLDKHNIDMDCENQCDDIEPAQCWAKYFLGEYKNEPTT